MFNRLKELRDKLASIPAFQCDAETRRELVEAIDALDDAMVEEVRTNHYLRTLTPEPDNRMELLAMFAGSATTQNEVPC